MVKVAIVYHSPYGHTERLARAVEKGAASVKHVQAQSFSVDKIDWDALAAADAIIFGSPTYMGSVTAPFKQFMDGTSKAWKTQAWKNKIAAGFTNSGDYSGDKLNTLVQLTIFAAQHSMIWVGLDIVPKGDRKHHATVNRLGSFLGAMAQSENGPPDESPPEGDLKTAEHLGKRVAEIAKKLA